MIDQIVPAKTALLLMLQQGESYGLELASKIEEKTAGKIALGPGTLYPALRNLESSGFATSREVAEKNRGGRPKVFYSLTSAGKKSANGLSSALRGLLGSRK